MNDILELKRSKMASEILEDIAAELKDFSAEQAEQPHWACGKVECSCDDDYDNYQDSLDN